jgi:hypothetical protein
MIDLECVTWIAMGQVWVGDPIRRPRPPPPPLPHLRENFLPLVPAPQGTPSCPTPPQYEFSIN